MIEIIGTEAEAKSKCGPTDLGVKMEKIPGVIKAGKILRERSLE